ILASVRFSMKGIAPSAPTTLPSLTPPLWSAAKVWPERWPLTSVPQNRTNLMLGLAMTLAMTFSRPRFSVLQDPHSAAPASQMPCSSRCEPMVTTATGLFASPEWKSPLMSGQPLAGDFLSAILFTSSHQYCRHNNEDQCRDQTYGKTDYTGCRDCRV